MTHSCPPRLSSDLRHLVDDATAVIDTYPPPEQPFDDGDVRPKLLRCGRYRTTVTSGLAFDSAILHEILPIPEEAFRQGADGRSEARRVGKECDSMCRSRWSRHPKKKN